MTETTKDAAAAVLEEMRRRHRSPRHLEEDPPGSLSGREVRTAVQNLLDEGTVLPKDSLKLEAKNAV